MDTATDRGHGARRWPVIAALSSALLLGACNPTYSPNTYAGSAVQQASKVEQGVVVGVRQVAVSVTGGVGAVTGATAGGITGAQVGTGAVSALSALGGTLLGGVVGATAEKVSSDTTAHEYIVRKPNNELISVTQKDEKPLAIGAKVLVITGSQARIVPDYTVGSEVAAAPPAKPAETGATGPSAKPTDPVQADRTEAASAETTTTGGTTQVVSDPKPPETRPAEGIVLPRETP